MNASSPTLSGVHALADAGEPLRRATSVDGTRYALFDSIAVGGSASIHLGRSLGQAGFARTVAIKRLRVDRAADPEYIAMLLDEARIGARIRHANAVGTLDVAVDGNEIWLVMDYIEGGSVLAVRRALGQGVPMPPCFAASMVAGMLHGLHAAHEARGDDGRPLGLVHRDVSPHNILVGTDGLPRIIDFGVSLASDRVQVTLPGDIKGKLGYFAPEQLLGDPVDRRADVFAAAVVLWECLSGRRLSERGDDRGRVLRGAIPAPSKIARRPPTPLDDVVRRGLAIDPDDRYDTAREMAMAIEEVGDVARSNALGGWISRLLEGPLRERAALVARVERTSVQSASSARVVIDLARARQSSPPSALESRVVAVDRLARARRSPWWLAVLCLVLAALAGAAAALATTHASAP